MNPPQFCNFSTYKELKTLSKQMDQEHNHLKKLIQDPERMNEFSIREDGFFYDFSKQRMDRPIFNELIRLAGETGAKEKFLRMTPEKSLM